MAIRATLLKFHELAVMSNDIVGTSERNTCAGLACAPCHSCSALPTSSGPTPVGWQERQLPMHRLSSGKHQPQFSLRIGSCLSCLSHLCLQGILSRLASGHNQSMKGNLSSLHALLLCKVFSSNALQCAPTPVPSKALMLPDFTQAPRLHQGDLAHTVLSYLTFSLLPEKASLFLHRSSTFAYNTVL